MLQRRHTSAQVAALLVLLLVPATPFLFKPALSTHMARQHKRPLIMQYANDLEEEGATSTSTLEIHTPLPAAVQVEAEVDAAR